MSRYLPRRSPRLRLARLEAARHTDSPPANPWETEEEWLEAFHAWRDRGTFDHVEDFPALLRRFEVALEEASHCEAFYPPRSYQPEMPESSRRAQWRFSHHYGELNLVFNSLLTMVEAVLKGERIVSRRELSAMRQWMQSVPYDAPVPPSGKPLDRPNILWAIGQEGHLIPDYTHWALRHLTEAYRYHQQSMV